MSPIKNPGTLVEAAELCGVSERTIRYHLAKGRFTGYKVKGHRALIVDLDEVVNALRSLPRRKSRVSADAYGPNARIVHVDGEEDQ